MRNVIKYKECKKEASKVSRNVYIFNTGGEITRDEYSDNDDDIDDNNVTKPNAMHVGSNWKFSRARKTQNLRSGTRQWTRCMILWKCALSLPNSNFISKKEVKKSKIEKKLIRATWTPKYKFLKTLIPNLMIISPSNPKWTLEEETFGFEILKKFAFVLKFRFWKTLTDFQFDNNITSKLKLTRGGGGGRSWSKIFVSKKCLKFKLRHNLSKVEFWNNLNFS